MSTSTGVSVGVTTKVGWGATALAFTGAVVTYLTGDQTAQELTAVEIAGAGLITLGITQIGRYAQAHKQIGLIVKGVESLAGSLGVAPAAQAGMLHVAEADLMRLAEHAAGKAVAAISGNGRFAKGVPITPPAPPPESPIPAAVGDPAPATPIQASAGSVADTGAAPTQ